MLEANKETFPQIGGIYSKSLLYLSFTFECTQIIFGCLLFSLETCDFPSACRFRLNYSIISFLPSLLICDSTNNQTKNFSIPFFSYNILNECTLFFLFDFIVLFFIQIFSSTFHFICKMYIDNFEHKIIWYPFQFDQFNFFFAAIQFPNFMNYCFYPIHFLHVTFRNNII